jgi:hypothetical protein
MGTISSILKQKAQAVNDYTSEPFVTEELSELGTIIDDADAPIEERILASRVMWNVCENRRIRATNQVHHWAKIHASLVHENERAKAKANLINQVNDKLSKQEGLEELLQAMLDKVQGRR